MEEESNTTQNIGEAPLLFATFEKKSKHVILKLLIFHFWRILKLLIFQSGVTTSVIIVVGMITIVMIQIISIVFFFSGGGAGGVQGCGKRESFSHFSHGFFWVLKV